MNHGHVVHLLQRLTVKSSRRLVHTYVLHFSKYFLMYMNRLKGSTTYVAPIRGVNVNDAYIIMLFVVY